MFDTRIDDIRCVLLCSGDMFSGGPDVARTVAAEWLSYGFNSVEVRRWNDAGCWDPSTAELFRKRGVGPKHAEKLCESYNRWSAASGGHIHDAMYAICNADLTIGKVVLCPEKLYVG